MKTEAHIFTHLAGNEIRDGKSHYPNVLTVVIDKPAALELIERLAHSLSHTGDQIDFQLVGKLEKSE